MKQRITRLVALIALIAAGTRDMHSINYTSGLLLALAGMAGYILML